MTFPKLLLPDWFDESCAHEVEYKGFFEHAKVQLASLEIIEVFFVDPHRLNQMLDDMAYVAEPGMIVLPSLTVENMDKVLPHLERSGFFNKLKARKVRADP